MVYVKRYIFGREQRGLLFADKLVEFDAMARELGLYRRERVGAGALAAYKLKHAQLTRALDAGAVTVSHRDLRLWLQERLRKGEQRAG